jgi:hypothetical protein
MLMVVGANVGETSLRAANIIGTKWGYSFDLNHINFNLLLNNININLLQIKLL